MWDYQTILKPSSSLGRINLLDPRRLETPEVIQTRVSPGPGLPTATTAVRHHHGPTLRRLLSYLRMNRISRGSGPA